MYTEFTRPSVCNFSGRLDFSVSFPYKHRASSWELFLGASSFGMILACMPERNKIVIDAEVNSQLVLFGLYKFCGHW